MRVVSLAPSATAIVRELDAADRLEGVTHHSSVDAPAVGGWLNPDCDRVADLDPDVVLTSDALQRDVRDDLRERGLDTVHHEPATLDDVLDSFAAVGDAIDCPAAGRALERDARERVAAVRERAPPPADRPVVYSEEWADPPMAAGNWVPDVLDAAGGRYPFVPAGERSREVDPDAVRSADPAHVFVHICGRGDRVGADPAARWRLDADVHVLHDDLLNQPSPRLLDGLERVAAALRDD